MKKSLFILLMTLFSGSLYATQDVIIECHACDSKKLSNTITYYTQLVLENGEYRLIIVDMNNVEFNEYKVSISRSSLLKNNRKKPKIALTKIYRSNQQQLNTLLKDAESHYKKAFLWLKNNTIEVPQAPYSSAYDALLYKEDFNGYLSHFANHQLEGFNLLIKRGEHKIKQLANQIETLAIPFVFASISTRQDITTMIKFSDHTQIKTVFEFNQDISTGLALAFSITNQAYDNTGKRLPRNTLELTNYPIDNTSLFNAFSNFLENKNINNQLRNSR